MTTAADKLYYQQMLDALTKACVAADITPEEVGRIRKMGGYQGHSKDNEGDVQVTDLFKWEISPKWDDGPQWPVIDQPTRPRIARVKPLVDRTADTITTLYVPDLQAGYILVEGREPIPMHDPRAMNLYIQINAIIRPDRVVYLGDNLDLADWSIKFARTPTMANSTNMTLVELLTFLEQMCAVNPDAEYDYLEGNHENRILKLLVANAEAAFGVKRPGERWPILSVPYLLNFDDLGIAWHGGYPAGAVWLRDDIRAIHGKRLSAERASKDPIIVSQFQGHCFHEEVELLTEHGWLPHDKLDVGMKAMTMNLETGAGEYQPINEVFRYDHFTELRRFKSRDIDIAVTDAHAMVSSQGPGNDGRWQKMTAAEMCGMGPKRRHIPLAVVDESDPIPLTDDQLRVIAWIVTEANVDLHFASGQGNAGVNVRIAQSDYDGHCEALESALDGAGIPWTRSLRYVAGETNHGQHRNYDAYRYQLRANRSDPCWRDWVFKWIDHDKNIDHRLLEMNGRQAAVFLDAYTMADGSTSPSGKARQLASNQINHLDAIQELAAKSGNRSSLNYDPDQRGGVGWVSINSRSTADLRPSEYWQSEAYDGIAWCVSVDNGTLLVRSRGKTIVTGNTHRMAAKSRTHTGLHGEPIHTIHVECGTGARIDGAVPSFGSGTDDVGAPVIGNEPEDWQQGCVISTHDPASHDLPEVELVPFTSGRCRLRGELLESEVGL